MTGDEHGLAGRVAGAARGLLDLVGRGRSHFERVEDVPCRVTVSGVRGKSTVVRWLNEALVARGFETYAKVTGNDHVSYHNLEPSEFERDGVVRLYENERELREFWPVDAVIAENQGIREYTTRLANELFDPHVVVLVNVRRDHQSTLGATLPDIARAFTRTVPEGAHVVSGDRNDAINDYLRREFRDQNVEFSVAEPRPEYPVDDVFGARSAFVVDETLRALGLDPLDPGQVASRVESLRGGWSWTRLDGGGLVCNGAMMNDVESTELLRQHLVERLDEPTVTPFVFLRRDRAGRTAAFVHYSDWLADNGFIDRVHVAGSHAKLFARRTTAEVVYHDHETTAPEAVLDACLDGGHPVYAMGNTVHPFMRAFDAEIERRAVE